VPEKKTDTEPRLKQSRIVLKEGREKKKKKGGGSPIYYRKSLHLLSRRDRGQGESGARYPSCPEGDDRHAKLKFIHCRVPGVIPLQFFVEFKKLFKDREGRRRTPVKSLQKPSYPANSCRKSRGSRE